MTSADLNQIKILRRELDRPDQSETCKAAILKMLADELLHHKDEIISLLEKNTKPQ